jgi:N6-adenosine-specific RNA methylase IME4
VEKFRTIVIDPPWPGPGECPAFDAAGASVRLIPYSTMTGSQVAALRVSDLATDDAQLFIWATSRSVADAQLLMQLWAFKFRGLFVWLKPGLGMGRHVRSQCEFLLWGGRRGSPLVDPPRCPRQVHQWPKPRRHSEKPAEAYEMIAQLSPGPRIDIFARQNRPGFEAWGNEVTAAVGQDARSPLGRG